MDQLTRDQLISLADTQGECLVSMYMPMIRAGREVQQNRIRFKNQLTAAEQSIEAGGGCPDSIRKQLDLLAQWEGEDDRWQHQADGLAVFLDGEKVRSWRLPADFPAVSHVSERFYLAPLCRLLQNNSRFYVIAVSKDHVSLYSASQWGISEVRDANLPDDLRSALNIDEYVSTLQHHSTSRGGEALFHGQGGADPDNEKQDEIKQYFHRVDTALTRYLNRSPAPLVFAGVEYLFPLFQQTCEYGDLLDTAVVGSAERMDEKQLQQEAWKIVSQRYDQQRGQVLERFGAAASSDLAVDDPREVLAAAGQGAVDTLLIRDAPSGPSEGNVTETAAQINQAVVSTLRASGDVVTVAEDQLDAPMAALLRFPIAATA